MLHVLPFPSLPVFFASFYLNNNNKSIHHSHFPALLPILLLIAAQRPLLLLAFFALLFLSLPAVAPLMSFAFGQSLQEEGNITAIAGQQQQQQLTMLPFSSSNNNTVDDNDNNYGDTASILAKQQQLLIQPLNTFLEQFFAVENSIDHREWEAALPSEWERREMRKLILFLFQLDDFGPITSDPGTFMAKFVPQLAKSMELTFLDQNRYCAIHEQLPPPITNNNNSSNSTRNNPPTMFPRFWGYTVLRSRAHSARPFLHHSAPHFQSDGDVCNQAAALFELTSARSLVIAGASRYAVQGKLLSPCQPAGGNAMADAAHNNQTMFHTMCAALLQAARIQEQRQQDKQQQENNNNNGSGGMENKVHDVDADGALFVQWHGMAESSWLAWVLVPLVS